MCIWQATKPRTMVSAVVASNNSAMSHKLQYNKQLLHRVINKHHQPNARAVCCTVLSLLDVSLWNGTATMIFKQWLSAGIKRACSQSESELFDMSIHLQPDSGNFMKRTPCRQQARFLNLHAARFAGKLFVSAASLRLSKLTLSLRRICRDLIRNFARCSASALELHSKILSMSR